MSRVNVTRFLVQHEMCKCKCRLNDIQSKHVIVMNVGVSLKN